MIVFCWNRQNQETLDSLVDHQPIRCHLMFPCCHRSIDSNVHCKFLPQNSTGPKNDTVRGIIFVFFHCVDPQIKHAAIAAA